MPGLGVYGAKGGKAMSKLTWSEMTEYQRDECCQFQPSMLPKDARSEAEKRAEMEEYAQKWGLKLTQKYLYAFRNHDIHGRGQYNKSIFYEPGKYYRDWHCDLNPKNDNSFGLGIWPKGNIPVRVKAADWGICVNREDGKCRVWGFTVLKEEENE